MRLNTAQRVLVAAALADRHHIGYGDALDYADTVSKALEVDHPDLVVVAAMFEEPDPEAREMDEWFAQQDALAEVRDQQETGGMR